MPLSESWALRQHEHFSGYILRIRQQYKHLIHDAISSK